MKKLSIALLGIGALALAAASPANAQFYKGKRITVLINYGAGGPTDVEGRLIAKHLAKHIPGKPRVIVKNLPGAGGIIGSNYMGEVAKPDGMTVAIFTPPTISDLLSDPGLRVKFGDFIWLAGVGQPQVCYMRKDAGVATPADVVKTKGFKAAGMRSTSSHDIRLRLSLDMIGAEYKYVTGYRGLAKVSAGVLQNETQYSCGSVPNYRSMVQPNLIDSGQAINMWYYAPIDAGGNEIKYADLAGIPTFLEVYRKVKGGGTPSGMMWDAYRQLNNLSTYMLRGSFVHGDTPKAAVSALRAAWAKLPGDKEFASDYGKAFKAPPKIILADEAKSHIDIISKIDPKIVAFLKTYTKTKK